MREIITKLYKFDELSDEAKETAREWFREGGLDYDWWDSVYEDVKAIAPLLGIEIKQKDNAPMNIPAIYFSGFSSQGDGACLEGSYRYAKDAPHKIKGYAPKDSELLRIAKELQAIQKAHGYRLTASLSHSGRYYHKYSVTIDIMDGEDSANEQTENAIKELLRDFMEWIYRQLEQSYEYLNSDEAVDETIQANEYEFTIDGKTELTI